MAVHSALHGHIHVWFVYNDNASNKHAHHTRISVWCVNMFLFVVQKSYNSIWVNTEKKPSFFFMCDMITWRKTANYAKFGASLCDSTTTQSRVTRWLFQYYLFRFFRIFFHSFIRFNVLNHKVSPRTMLTRLNRIFRHFVVKLSRYSKAAVWTQRLLQDKELVRKTHFTPKTNFPPNDVVFFFNITHTVCVCVFWCNFAWTVLRESWCLFAW